MTLTQLSITGMSCDGCVRGVTKALSAVPGVTVQHVAIGSARVEHDPAKVPAEDLVGAVQRAGFEATVAPTNSTSGGANP